MGLVEYMRHKKIDAEFFSERSVSIEDGMVHPGGDQYLCVGLRRSLLPGPLGFASRYDGVLVSIQDIERTVNCGDLSFRRYGS
jgi:hypothetical protein